ncbi:MAG: Flp family type IVb pilin [Parvibaculum sp.]|uniref:Flp family type IVb pilin n=1 Tax=Parvibaculum sp. TaxID=2024848 RepID=UPI00283BAFF8|nr:Flp family type IVb pilin [Parvibaculum sp.]MDR3498182.1 Flp family type IVb pilin [Parvibaculum sp.]
MHKFLISFARNDSGATAIEYGLIAAGIAVAIATIVGTVGTSLTNKFTDVNSRLQ